MDTKVKKLITYHRMYYPRVDIERLYIKKGNGERIDLKTTNGSKKYFDTITDWLLQLINTHEKQKEKYLIHKENRKFAKQLVLREIDLKSSY